MSEIIDTEWFDLGATLPGRTLGVVLIYNEDAGFKCYIGVSQGGSEESDAHFIYQHGQKLAYRIAKAVWGKRMAVEWLQRHLADKDLTKLKYDGEMYPRGEE